MGAITGQILQSLASASVWIVAFATLVDNIDEQTKGKVTSTAMSFVSMGVFAGPMVSGSLLQLLGYWPAWCAALLLLAVDFLARLLMIETPSGRGPKSRSGGEERSPLLSEADQNAQNARADGNETETTTDNTQSTAPRGFYRIMLTNPQILASLLPVGLTFFGLQVPSIALGPGIGWLRDRIGLRYPTTIAWGFWLALMRGAGAFQMMAVVHELERKTPNLFGSYGGNSRLSGLSALPFNIGMMVGPLLSGTFSEYSGYYWTCFALAVVALLVAASSWVYMTAQGQEVRESEEEGMI
ncbi:major facilitator superfamily domain-containing protein [Aspergillus desertorum]